MTNRAELAQRAVPISKQVAEVLQREETEITELSTPFLIHGSIYRISSRPPLRPLVFTMGVAGPDYAVLLGKNPPGFLDMAARAGVNLDTDPLRIAYVTTYLETTCDQLSGFQILSRFDDIRVLNKPKQAEKERLEKLRQQYSSQIVPPRTSKDDPWKVNLFAVDQRNLIAIQASLQPDGKVTVEKKILEEAIPVTYSK